MLKEVTFGVNLPDLTGYDEIRRVALEAERLGFSRVPRREVIAHFLPHEHAVRADINDALLPEQAGDLYQGKGRDSGNFVGPTPPDGNILPGALNPDTKSLDNGRQPDPRE